MRILVTGSKGFIGQNLILNLKARGYDSIYEFDIDTDISLLDKFCEDCDFVYHLAGINRPKDEAEFMDGNFGSLSSLLEMLEKHKNKASVMLSSSIQAELENPYGKSKRAGEDLLIKYGEKNNVKTYIFRFPNLFGKWSRPNYNSVVATFCHNIANGKEIKINDPDAKLRLVYIDDVINELIGLLNGNGHYDENGFYYVPDFHDTTVGKLADIISSFPMIRNNRTVPYLKEGSLEKKLYSTYLSYLPKDKFSYPLDMHIDNRGSFTEIIRTAERGQVSVNISKPGIEKGNHWHNTKNEKFCVVSGKALIQFRKPDDEEIISYHVSGDKIEVVDIPCGYTHNIINEGETDLVTIMWCNECFDPENPDTFFCKVNE